MLELVDMNPNNKDKESKLILKKSEEMKIKDSFMENNKRNCKKIIGKKVLLLKDIFLNLRKKRFIIKELKGLAIFLVIYFFYALSLETCLMGQEHCSVNLIWQYNKVLEELISCIFGAFALELIFYKKISKIHLIHFFITFALFYAYSHGVDFHDHGFYNFIYFFIIVTLIIIAFLPINFIINIIQSKKPKIYVFLFILLLIIIGSFIIIIFINGSNCDGWGKGLNNTSIINDDNKYDCEIQFPTKCTYKLIYYFQDYTRLFGKTCSKYIKENSKENLIEKSKSPYFNSTTTHFGFPLSNKDPSSIKNLNRESFENNFFDNLVDMDNKAILEKYFKNKIPEVSVDFTNNIQGKININLHFNETLSQERKKLEKNSEPYSNNILIIYIDALSRQNAIRELKKTLNFIEQFMSYQGGFNKKYPDEKYHSFEFFKYHTFIGHTSINFPLLFYGQNRTVKNKVLINKYFKMNGYVTNLAHDSCLRDNTLCDHEFIEDEVYDHEFNLCDPN